MALPRFVFVKSNDNKYLRYVKEVGPYHARLQFTDVHADDESVEVQYIKFEFEPATTGDNGLVHIKNCYNNKYFARKSSESNLIVGEANEAEEDQSKWSCTLFKPIFVDSVEGDDFVSHGEHQKIRLLHIDQLGEQYARVIKSEDEDSFNLQVAGDQDEGLTTDGDVFTLQDATSMVILPDYVSFKGHSGQYCAITTLNGNPYMEFKTDNFGATGAVHITQSYPQTEMVRILNKYNNQYWALSGNYIMANNGSSRDLTPIRLGGNVVAFRCIGNGKLVNCGAGQGMTHALGASTYNLQETSMFQVAEPVLLREISNVNYNLEDARIYNISDVQMFIDSRSNNTSVAQNGTFSVSYTKSHTTKWSNSVSVTTGISANWSFSIPYVGDFGVELSREETKSREWGEETTEEETVAYSQNVVIPPRTKVTLRVVAKRASCDVPFTCVVRDTMTDGTIRTYTKEDGLFTGSNGYQFDTLMTEEDL